MVCLLCSVIDMCVLIFLVLTGGCLNLILHCNLSMDLHVHCTMDGMLRAPSWSPEASKWLHGDGDTVNRRIAATRKVIRLGGGGCGDDSVLDGQNYGTKPRVGWTKTSNKHMRVAMTQKMWPQAFLGQEDRAALRASRDASAVRAWLCPSGMPKVGGAARSKGHVRLVGSSPSTEELGKDRPHGSRGQTPTSVESGISEGLLEVVRVVGQPHLQVTVRVSRGCVVDYVRARGC
jgi:hypothetical protein